MSVTDLSSPPGAPGEPPGFVGPSPQERAWSAAAGVAVSVMGTVNAEVARLAVAVGDLLDTDGWVGMASARLSIGSR